MTKKVKVLVTRTRSVMETAEVVVEVEDFIADTLRDPNDMEHWAKAMVVPTIGKWTPFAQPAPKVDVKGKILDEDPADPRSHRREIQRGMPDENVVRRMH
jgi:hypothetical protein